MKFQIRKLIVWPKDCSFPPRVVEFETGKLNVITGASRTGKSAIIPIIDYCLASSDCNIPIDTIRDYSSWYGLEIETSLERILICRKVPKGTKVSREFYVNRGTNIIIPNRISEKNENLDGVKNLLNVISSVPYFKLNEGYEAKGFQERLSFRDLMALVFQTQDIVANQNILFYKTHAHEHRERLRNWFPYILGAENLDTLIARQKIIELERRLNRLKREHEKSIVISRKWVANMQGHLNIAKEYGLINEISNNEDKDELISKAKYIVGNVPDYSMSKVKNIEKANKELIETENVYDELSEKIASIQKRLSDISKLKSGFSEYGSSLKKRTQRLSISTWISSMSDVSNECPLCGNNEHINAKNEIQKITESFRKYEEKSKKMTEVPTSFSREEVRLKSQLEDLLDERRSVKDIINIILKEDSKARSDFQKKKEMYLFIGHLKASLETFENLTSNDGMLKEIDNLQKEYDNLMKKLDANTIKKKLDYSRKQIAQKMLKRLQTLDVEKKYRKVSPIFSVSDLNIKVPSDDGNYHFLAEVGSASNWVSFHIAISCAIQEFLIEQDESCVPSFVIFDQPSQVYFPRVLRGEDDENLIEGEEDQNAVKQMFKTISSSIREAKGEWQSIILDHADDTIYGEIEDVHEVEVWRNGNKLIPEEWYS